MKFYAVKVGKKPGIYTTWTECKAQVNKFQGAVFKSFTHREDAVAFIEEYYGTDGRQSPNRPLIAYVDGSYNASTHRYGFGCVLIEGQQVIDKLNGSGNDSDFVSMRNVAGEICGSLSAMNYAAKNGYDYLCIYYDYYGIEKWANGEWKANKPGTRRYRQLVNKFREHISIDFMKVLAHSGDTYNEMADRLAKHSVGI